MDSGSTSVLTAPPTPSTQVATCPSVDGQAEATAEATLRAAGCTVGSVSQQNAAAPAGDVIGQSPAPPERKGTKVALVVSLGPVQYCPSVLNETEAAAEGALRSAGCAVGSVSQQNSAAPAGVVIQESPAPPERKGTTVALVVSLGPVQYCPSVLNETEAAAESALRSAGCAVGSVSRQSSAAPAGVVIQENPPPPEQKGTTISLVVSSGP